MTAQDEALLAAKAQFRSGGREERRQALQNHLPLTGALCPTCVGRNRVTRVLALLPSSNQSSLLMSPGFHKLLRTASEYKRPKAHSSPLFHSVLFSSNIRRHTYHSPRRHQQHRTGLPASTTPSLKNCIHRSL